MSEAGRQRANRRLTWKLAAFTAGSFAFGFALVPLYSLLCNITGAGTEKALTQASARQGGAVDARREVTIELLATLPTVGNWEFRPVVGALKVHPGRLYEAEFYAHNLTGRDVVAQAIPDVAQVFSFHGFKFEVLRRQKNQIMALRVTPPEAAASG